MSSGAAQAAYPLWAALAILCAAVSGRIARVAAEREGLAFGIFLKFPCDAFSELLPYGVGAQVTT